MSVKRYDSNGFESEYGVWVRAVDYDALVEQHSKSGGDWETLRAEVEAIVEKLEDGFDYDEEAKKFFAVWTERELEAMRAQARRVYGNLPQPHKPNSPAFCACKGGCKGMKRDGEVCRQEYSEGTNE